MVAIVVASYLILSLALALFYLIEAQWERQKKSETRTLASVQERLALFSRLLNPLFLQACFSNLDNRDYMLFLLFFPPWPLLFIF